MIKAKPYLDTNPSVYGKMSVMSAEYKAINFSQGVAEFDTPKWLLEKANYYINNGYNQYAPIPGSAKLRQAIIEKIKICYDVEIAFENISITNGAIEGLSAVITAYIDQGDEVIVFDPIFDAYVPLVQLNRGTPIRLNLQSNGALDTQALADAISDKTKMIIINSPQNPLGSVVSREEYKEIAKLIRGKNIILVADEVYEHIYAGESFTSTLQIPELKNQLVVLQSLGKTYNVTGWRIGVCIAPEDITKNVLAVKQFATFSPSNPMQLALADVIIQYPEYYLELHKIYKKQNSKLDDGLTT